MEFKNAQEYYRRLRQIEAELQSLVEANGGKVIFIKHRETGRVGQCDIGPAAKAIIAQTHVVATAEEIAAYNAKQDADAAELAKRNAARLTTYILPAGTPAPVAPTPAKGK